MLKLGSHMPGQNYGCFVLVKNIFQKTPSSFTVIWCRRKISDSKANLALKGEWFMHLKRCKPFYGTCYHPPSPMCHPLLSIATIPSMLPSSILCTQPLTSCNPNPTKEPSHFFPLALPSSACHPPSPLPSHNPSPPLATTLVPPFIAVPQQLSLPYNSPPMLQPLSPAVTLL
jgi:hypothetical protein